MIREGERQADGREKIGGLPASFFEKVWQHKERRDSRGRRPLFLLLTFFFLTGR